MKENINDITKEDFEKAINSAIGGGYTSYAPLGAGGQDKYLYYDGAARRSEVSVRLHSGMVKMLLTNQNGRFVFYGGFSTRGISTDFMASEFHGTLTKLKHLMVEQVHDKNEMLKTK